MNKTLRLLSLMAMLLLTARYASAQSGNITFADERVKAICVYNNWDTNRDGEISYDEAAAVTELGYNFRLERITSFDELQYFTSLTSIPNVGFYNCSNLRSLTFPESLVSIGTDAFSNCTQLTSITLPNSVTNIGDGAFNWCSGLQTITIPNSVQHIGQSAFNRCNSLTTVECYGQSSGIVDNESNAVLCSNAFSGCSELTIVAIPASVKSIEEGAFYDCGKLMEITIPQSVASIDGNPFSACPALKAVHVEEGSNSLLSDDGVVYTKDKKRIICYPVGKSGTSYNIASTVETIGKSAFKSCVSLVSVTIPNSVTSIGDGAFYGCSSVTDFTISNLVTYIGANAFNGCSSVTDFTIPNLVTYIGDYAFSGCSSITSFTIPNSVTYIGANAFNGCSNVTDFTIPNSVTYIGGGAFYGTGISTLNIPKSVVVIGDSDYPSNPAGGLELEAVYVEDGNPSFTSEDGILFNKDLTAIICYPPRKMNKSYAIPNTVTCIGHSAFANCTNLSTVSIGSNVEFIGNSAFIWCSSLRDIYCYVKYDESDPYRLEFGFNLNIFLLSTDWNNPIVPTLHVPSGCKQYYEQFSLWNRMNIVEMDGTIIQFADENVKAICVANWDTDGDGELSYDEAEAVTDLGIVFRGNESITSFDELQYFTGLKSIGDWAFCECSGLTSVIIPEGVTSIGDGAFYSSGLTSVTISEGVTSIGGNVFGWCSSLTSVTLPSSMTSIGYGAFRCCHGLTSITVDADNAIYDSRNGCNAIIETATNTLIVGCQNTVIPLSITSIGSGAFEGCSGLTNVNIPSSVSSIGSRAFEGCTGLTSITVDAGNAVYDSRNGCNAIIETATNTLIVGCQNTVIPSNVTSIGSGAFEGCSGLTSSTIPEGVTSIGSRAFEGCTGLTSVTIPSSVTGIGDYAFLGCHALTSVTIPEGVTRIGSYAFAYCSSLTSVTIPSSMTSIGGNAFYGCSSLTSVTSLIKEPFDITDDVFMYYDESYNFLFTSATLYVPAGTKGKYEATPAWNQFQNIVEMDIEPMDQGEKVDFASVINAGTDLDGKVVGDIYYSIGSGDGSYDPTEGCIVVTTPTDDSSIDSKNVFGEGFTGIVFKVAEGKGTIKIEAQTTGTMVMKVKIGDNDPIEMELEGKLKVSFPYNVSEDTYVFIYGGSKAAQAGSMRRAAADGSLMIYGIEVEKGAADDIGTVQVEGDDDAPVYNLNGQRVNTPARGVYIKGGKKILVK